MNKFTVLYEFYVFTLYLKIFCMHKSLMYNKCLRCKLFFKYKDKPLSEKILKIVHFNMYTVQYNPNTFIVRNPQKQLLIFLTSFQDHLRRHAVILVKFLGNLHFFRRMFRSSIVFCCFGQWLSMSIFFRL